MSHAGFQWSDEAPQAPPAAAAKGFQWSDEAEAAPDKTAPPNKSAASTAEPSVKSGLDVKDARTIPNARIRNLPNPAEGETSPGAAFYHGAKTGLTLGSIPASIGVPLPELAGAAVGGTVGSEAGKFVAKKAGAGELGQEMAGDAGGVVGGGIGAARLGGGIRRGIAPVADAIRGPEPTFPGAPLPEHPGVFPGAHLPENPGVFPGAPFPEDPGIFPGAPEPATPAPEVLQANSLLRGPQRIADPAAALERIPAPGQAGSMASSVEAPGVVPAKLAPRNPARVGDLLNESLGGKIPEGHTPVKSSAIRSYKYDPETREFEATTASGTYIHGDVSPDQVAAFEKASSKGKAWSDLKNNSTYVGKIVNGERVSAKPPRDLGSASPDDLTPILQQSIESAKKSRAARIAKPN